MTSIDKISDQSGELALRKAPLVIAGICEAGQFACEFSAYAPDRTEAFLTMGGSKHDIRLAPRAAVIPGLLIAATDRGEDAVNNMFELFSEGRKHSAPWAFSTDLIVDYDKGSCSKVAMSFLEATLERLSKIPIRETRFKLAGRVGVPVSQMPFQMHKYPEAVANALNKIHASGVECRFPSLLITEDWLAPDLVAQASGLSFVSIALPALGTVAPEGFDIGTIFMKPAQSTGVFAKLEVQGNPEMDIDGVDVVTDQKDIIYKIKADGDHRWQIECTLDPKGFPCGGFRVEIPIRFLRSGRIIPGGVSAWLTGCVSGDIHPEPIAITVDGTGSSSSEYSLHLKSTAGSKIDIIHIQSSFPSWATANVETSAASSVELKCRFNPPQKLRGKTFSGYFLIRAKSNHEESIRILFYGEVSA